MQWFQVKGENLLLAFNDFRSGKDNNTQKNVKKNVEGWSELIFSEA